MEKEIALNRKIALLTGARYYYGKPCKNCRTNIKTKNSCHCVECKKRRRCSEHGVYMRKKYKLRRLYGLSIEQYNTLYQKQNGKCAICKICDIRGVDHCHVSGTVRGLLCNECNAVLGFAKDDPKILKAAVKYLIRKPK